MSDHVKMSGAAKEGCEHDDARTHDDEGDADFVQFKLPLLRLRERREQKDFLLLAWALLLHRGSSGSESGDQEAGFTYAFRQPANGHSSPMLEVVVRATLFRATMTTYQRL